MKKSIMLALIAISGMIQAMSQENAYLPITREGVKWVNEKVIVNNGDTTCYYYKYEFSGDDSTCTNLSGVINKACYYYTGSVLDVENDSLIAGLLDNYVVTCFRNDAYFKNLREGRMMMKFHSYTDGGTVQLYSFDSY